MSLTATEPRPQSDTVKPAKAPSASSNGHAPNGHAHTGGPTNPFDLTALRLRRDAGPVGATKSLAVDVHRPKKQVYFRVHPSPDYVEDCYIFESEENRETFWVIPDLWDALPGALTRVRLYTCMTRQGDTFLWPAKLPDEGGRQNRWHDSALDHATVAMSRWIRIQANMAAGRYDRWIATGDLSEPVWPGESFQELIALAFNNNCIATVDHFAIRALAGEI